MRNYMRKSKQWPVFLVCRASLLDLEVPRQIDEAFLVRVFGRIPGTLTRWMARDRREPPPVEPARWEPSNGQWIDDVGEGWQ